MINNELKEILFKAKNDIEESMLLLIEKYDKLIKSNSYINGKVNKDLEQDLICKMIESIKKFEI